MIQQTTKGHAAVGRVVGQRLPDGSKPELAEITYVRKGEKHNTVVRRESASQQVEHTSGDTVRFWSRTGRVVLVDKLLDAEPYIE